MGALVYLTLLGTTPLKTVDVQTEYLDYFTRKYVHASDMVFTIQKVRAGANLESPEITQPGTNIREGINLRRLVFTREHKNLFIQPVLQYNQENESDELHYHVLGSNESSIEDNMKKSYCYLDLDFTLTKISIHRLLK